MRREPAVLTAALVSAVLAPLAGAGTDFGPFDNRCTLSRIALGGAPAATRALVDGDFERPITVDGDAAEIEVRFIGAPRWINAVTLYGASHAFAVDVLEPEGDWFAFGRGAGAPAGGSAVIGDDVLVAGIRVRPDALVDDRVSWAEIEARFVQIDPDVDETDGSGDGLEYFYEWIEDYPTSPLYDCEEDAANLCNGLSSDWDCRGYGDWSAWEEDFKRNDLGGTNGLYVDSADLAFFSGHGTSAYDAYWGDSYRAMFFADSAHDDSTSIPSDARQAWDNDLEWFAFSACDLLSYPSRSKWHEALNGAHALFGWGDSIPDKRYGKKWAKGMNGTSIFDPAKTLKQAWFDMAESKVGSGYAAVVVGENSGMGNDYLWGEGTTGSDPAHDSSYTVWTYVTTAASALAPPSPGLEPRDLTTIAPTGPRGVEVHVPRDLLEQGAVDGTSPVFKSLPAEVSAEFVDLLANRLCQLFPILCEGDFPEPTLEDTINKVSGFHELRVSTLTGGFEFVRSNVWWRTWDEAPQIPGEGEAAEMANQALSVLDGYLPLGLTMVGTRTAVQATEDSAGGGAPMESFPVHRQVVYRRRLGGMPVFGAGGEVSVCVGVDGVERISRNAGRKLAVAGAMDTIPLSAALARLAELGSDAALDGVSGQWTSMTVLDAQLGYYEFDDEAEQQYLRPVWYIVALGEQGDEFQSEVQFAIEADPNPLRVTIDGPVGEDPFCFAASVLGGVEPYAFNWHSGVDGDVGSTPSICYTPSADPDPDKGVAPPALTVTLEVTDASQRVARARVTLTRCDIPDADGDGVVAVGDVLVVLQQWGQAVDPGTGGDVDGDGTVGIGDLLLVLQSWGLSC